MRFLLTLLTVASIGAVCSFLLYLVLWLYHWHQDRQAARRRLMPDASGRYPVPLETAQAVLIEQARAMQAVPHSLTFSPRIDVKPPTRDALPDTSMIDGKHDPEATDVPALPIGRVDLADLLMSHQPSVDRILLAIGPGGVPLTVHAGDLCHVALAGATGGGKSNIMRLLLSQLLAAGAQVVLADPHYTPLDVDAGDDWRPIAGRLKLAPAVKASDIQHLLAWLATDELPRRLELRRNGQPVGRPLFLAIDELTAIVSDVKDAPAHMSRILREGRKVGLLTIGAAQDFLVKTIGGAGAVRDCYRTAFYVGGDQQTARVLLDVSGRVDDGHLGPGLAYLRSRVTTPAQLVRVPLASNGAIERLLPSHDKPTTIEVASGSARSGLVAAAAVARSTPLPAHQEAPDARSQRVRELLRAAAPQREILREVWGITTNGGAAYTRASAELREIVARLV